MYNTKSSGRPLHATHIYEDVNVSRRITAPGGSVSSKRATPGSGDDRTIFPGHPSSRTTRATTRGGLRASPNAVLIRTS